MESSLVESFTNSIKSGLLYAKKNIQSIGLEWFDKINYPYLS